MNFKVDDIVICLNNISIQKKKGNNLYFIKNKIYKIVNITEIHPDYLIDKNTKKYKITLNRKRKTEPYLPFNDDFFNKHFVSLKQLRKNKIKNISDNFKY